MRTNLDTFPRPPSADLGKLALDPARVLQFQAQSNPAVLLCLGLPVDAEVVGGGGGVAGEALHRVGVEQHVTAAGLEQAVHGSNGKFGHVGLIPAASGPLAE